VTPGDAARAVRRLLDAERVDGVSASRRPRPGHLLPLGPDGRFPASVVPPGARGPRGAQGPSGPTGPRGPSDVIVRRRDDRAFVGLAAGSSVTVATIAVPAGQWLLRAEGEIDYFPARGPHGDWFFCGLVVDGTAAPQQRALMGNVTGATHRAEVMRSLPVSSPTDFRAALRCSHESALPADSDPSIVRTTLTAVRTESLDVQDVTG
jgi:hypothetical protein